MNPFDEKVIYSFHDQISRGHGFTEKQSLLAIKILSRQSAKLTEILGKDVEPFLENPVFRLTRRTINSSKRITIIPNDTFTKVIKVEFPYNESLVERIRKEREKLSFAQWSKEDKAWIVALTERAIQFFTPFVKNEEFVADDEFLGYMDQSQEIQDNIEKYVPTISYVDNKLKFLNVSSRMPQLTTDDPMEALFEGRKRGIYTWDESISQYLKSISSNELVIDFLNESPGSTFTLNLEETSIFDISPIIKHLGPTVFIIPGGSELEKVKTGIELLKAVGVENSDISILFRLPKEVGENFNNFVKENQLNNPITETTKAVFISSKIPKTIIDPKIKFNCVVNFNFYSVHYTIREFIKNHHNVINIMEKKLQRNLNFGNM
jgi:hypothetical protein